MPFTVLLVLAHYQCALILKQCVPTSAAQLMVQFVKKNIPEPTMAHTALHLPFPLKVVPARLCKTVQVTAPAPVEFVPPFFLYHAIAALRQGCQCCLDVRFGPRS
jgi:hypothetical protein